MLGLGILTWVKIGALVLAVGAFAWLVDDYAWQRSEREAAEARAATLAAALVEQEAAIRRIEAVHRASEAATRDALDRRTAEAARLEAQLATLNEVPDDPACPLPAAIGRALDLVREQP